MGNTFSKQNVTISDLAIERLIYNFCGQKEAYLDTFYRLLCSTGIITTPVKLSNLDTDTGKFDCTTKEHQHFQLSFSSDELFIYDGSTIITYAYKRYCTNQCLTFKRIHIENDNKIMRHTNFGEKQLYTLNFPQQLSVSVDVSEPVSLVDNTKLMQSRDAVRRYLLTLTTSCNAVNIYNSIIELYDFDSKLLPHVELIDIAVKQCGPIVLDIDHSTSNLYAQKKDIRLSRIRVNQCKVVSYATNDGVASYGIHENGDWFYKTPHADISYNKKQDFFSAHLVATPTIVKSDIATIFDTASEKVDSIRDKIN